MKLVTLSLLLLIPHIYFLTLHLKHLEFLLSWSLNARISHWAIPRLFLKISCPSSTNFPGAPHISFPPVSYELLLSAYSPSPSLTLPHFNIITFTFSILTLSPSWPPALYSYKHWSSSSFCYTLFKVHLQHVGELLSILPSIPRHLHIKLI